MNEQLLWSTFENFKDVHFVFNGHHGNTQLSILLRLVDGHFNMHVPKPHSTAW